MKVFIFSNPVTLQLVLSHFGDVLLAKVSKKGNSEEVKRLAGVENYDAEQEQIKTIINKIHFNTIEDFKNRLAKLSTDFNDIPSSNFLIFLERFENNDTTWIDDINSLRKH